MSHIKQNGQWLRIPRSDVAESRSQARALGKIYYQGNECDKGHDGVRSAANGGCTSCAALNKSRRKLEKENEFFGHASKMVEIDHRLEDLACDDYSLDSIKDCDL